MPNTVSVYRRILLITTTLIFATFYPLLAVAVVSAETDTQTTPPVTETTTAPSSTPGPQQPNGDAARTYTYNEATGMWENDYYIWDPVTRQTRPKNEPTYSYNPTTSQWDTSEWRYDAAQGRYVPNTVSTPTPPASSTTQADNPTTNGSPTNARAANSLANPESSLTGPSSINEINQNSAGYGNFDLFYNASISNNINSTANSGNALVGHNTLGGNALTGDAEAMATIINMLQSSWDPSGGNLTFFNYDINGDVVGDLYVDPDAVANSNLSVNNLQDNQLTINVLNNAEIDNNVNLVAGSGNATVDSNTSAGDATTGSANAMANIMNFINSSIGSGQSFIGSININGNFEGDILLPPYMMDMLLAANSAPAEQLDTSVESNSELVANFTENQTIDNTINLSASTGNAVVSNNTSAGNATSGNAQTNLTLLNLTGRQVVGENCLLVFVNVLGEWVGVIMDAPSGSTAAALGGGISQNSSLSNQVDVDIENNSTIHNNVNVAASSGDATVSNNTSAGDATTGDATASANILNVIGSQFSVSDWFGILFINVFNSWHGSFGVNTEAGNLPVATSNPSTTSNSGDGGNNTETQVFRFEEASSEPKARKVTATGTSQNNTPPSEELATTSQQATGGEGQVLGASADPVTGPANNWIMPVLGSTLGLCLLGLERVLTFRQKRREILAA